MQVPIFWPNSTKTAPENCIALDVGALAPVVAFAGVFLMVFVKEARLQHIGQIMAGLGILFIGMDTMSAAAAVISAPTSTPIKRLAVSRSRMDFIRLPAAASNPELIICRAQFYF